jgi:hypothetical protein
VKESGSVVGIDRVVQRSWPVTILEKLSSDSIGKIAVATHNKMISVMWSSGAEINF